MKFLKHLIKKEIEKLSGQIIGIYKWVGIYEQVLKIQCCSKAQEFSNLIKY